MPPRVRESLKQISPYKAGDREVEGASRIIKLSSNENTAGPSPRALEAYAKAAEHLELYPEPSSARLREALAGHWGLEADRIITGTGSDNLLDLICQAYAGPGDEVLFPALTFPMYEIAALGTGATPVKAAMYGDAISIDALLEAVSERTKVVYLANPNNPTGHVLPKGEVERLRTGLPEDVLLVLDSAYAEYVEDAAYTAGTDLVKAAIASGAGNVIMTRTFSKMYALASLRIGWAYGPDAVIDALGRIRPPFAVSGPAEEAALAALADDDAFRASLAVNSEWHCKVAAELSGLGFQVTEGAGNFIFFRVPPAMGLWSDLDAHLKSRGIIVRAMPPAEALRVTIGKADENEAFLAAAREFAGRNG